MASHYISYQRRKALRHKRENIKALARVFLFIAGACLCYIIFCLVLVAGGAAWQGGQTFLIQAAGVAAGSILASVLLYIYQAIRFRHLADYII